MPLLPQVAISFVRILYQFWLQQGIPQRVLDEVLRIDLNDQKTAKFGISSDRLALLHAAVNKATNDRVLSLRLGQYLGEKDLELESMICYSETLHQGLLAMSEHSRVISESGYFSFSLQDNGRYALKFIAHDKVAFSSQQKDMVFSTILSWIEKVYTGSHNAIYYYFDENVATANEYQTLLSCHLIAGGEVFIEINADLLMINNRNKDSSLLEKCIRKTKKIITKRQQRLDLYAEVTQCISESLLSGTAQQEVVAERLNISVRNLQRRLKEVGTSYQSILDDCREALALKLIKNIELPLYEVSYLVGFTEPSAFYKAFRRWTGKRPGDYRQSVLIANEELAANEASSADVSPC